ncbi:MAG: hypothetical protein EOO99_03570 [Pedobacter sp.]|nr:MAG: hypothetical protein EOO99_03570 [Pedobacter sp.]
MEENIDYYFNDQGLMVFTAAYHLKRGFCCKNNCLNCPWKKKPNAASPNNAQKPSQNDDD